MNARFREQVIATRPLFEDTFDNIHDRLGNAT
jgi:hypothetical protein